MTGIRIKPRTFETTTCSEEATRGLGRLLGSAITVATVIGLTGDLGSGKTAFVQGLAKGLAVPDEYYITSPSFTLVNSYPGRLALHHVDLYRIEDPSEAVAFGLEEVLEEDGVVAIEWAEKIPHLLPPEHLTLQFEIMTDESRKIRVKGYGPNGVNLVKRLEAMISTGIRPA